MSAFDFILLGLTSWRLSYMLSMERGPGDLFLRLRRALHIEEDQWGTKTSHNFLGQLVACPICLSLWVATTVFILYSYANWLYPAFLVLSISGAASIIHHLVRS